MPSTLIDIPPDDVFRYDTLGLEPAIQEHSERLLASSPQAIAIDAGWGSGKTTFMRLWAAYLRKEGVKVVEFNAWKFSLSDPLDALTREILRQFDNIPEEKRGPSHRGLINLIRRSVLFLRQGVKLGVILSPEFAEAAENLEPVAEVVETVAEQGFTTQTTGATEPKIDSPDAFTSALSAAAKNWSEQPVVIMVDELDRCSPEYAVEMLQLLEHIFYAENVVFVVSMNRGELVHSVRAFYGEGFDADGYLERFFDNVFGLPTSKRESFIASSLELVQGKSRAIWQTNAQAFLNASELSLREIQRAVEQLEGVLHLNAVSVSGNALLYLWLARTLAPMEYRQFISGENTDKELATAVFSNGDCGQFRGGTNRRDYGSGLEATLIGAFRNPKLFPDIYMRQPIESDLYEWHQTRVSSNADSNDLETHYSDRVLEHASNLINYQEYASELASFARLLERDAPPQED